MLWRFRHVEVQGPRRRCSTGSVPLRRCSTRLGTLRTAPRRTPLETTVSRPSCRRTSTSRPGNSSPARRPSASAARCCSARQTPSGWSRRARRQLLLSRSGSAIDCPSYHLYGYDRDTLRRRPTTRRSTTVIRFDDAQRHDARRRHARHPPHPDDTHDPNVRRKRRLGAELPKPVYLFQRPQTCNRCETNPSR